MAGGFWRNEPRLPKGSPEGGRWTTDRRVGERRTSYAIDHTMSPREAALHDISGIHRKAYQAVSDRQAKGQLIQNGKLVDAGGVGKEFKLSRKERAKVAYRRAHGVYQKQSDKFYKTKGGKIVDWLYRDRFTGLVPPGSKRDAIIRGLAAASGLVLSGGLSALSPTWAAGKAWRAADWGVKAHARSIVKKEKRAAKAAK